MTVSSTTGKSGPYNGNGVTVAFEYEFRILDATHVTVILNSAGAETLLTQADYSVSGVGDSGGGSVTLNTAPETGETITLVRNAPFTQPLDLENQGAYYAETVERALDLAAMRDQQLSERLDRTVQIPVSADAAELDMLIAGIVRIGDSADEIDTVAGIAGDVTAVAGIAADVSAVAGMAVPVAIVAAIDDDVIAVAANASNINAVAGIEAEIIAVPAQVEAAQTAATDAAQSAADAALFDPANYLPKAGGTMSGRLETAASTAERAGLSVPEGVAPTAPVIGDIWQTAAGLVQARLVGPATRTFAFLQAAAQSWTRKQTFAASVMAEASIRVQHGVAPTAPTDGDLWSTIAGWFVRTNGVTQRLLTDADVAALTPDYGAGSAALTRGAVGTYALLRKIAAPAVTAGATVAGSALDFASVNAAGAVAGSGVSPGGTWRNEGFDVNGGAATLFKRLS